MGIRKKHQWCGTTSCNAVDIDSDVFDSNGTWAYTAGVSYSASTDDAWLLFDPPLGNSCMGPWYVTVNISIAHGIGATPEIFVVGGASTLPTTGHRGNFFHDGRTWCAGNLAGGRYTREIGHTCTTPGLSPLGSGTKTSTLVMQFDGITVPRGSRDVTGSSSTYGMAGRRCGFGIITASGCTVTFSALSGEIGISPCMNSCTRVVSIPLCFSVNPEYMDLEIPSGVLPGAYSGGGTFSCRNCHAGTVSGIGPSIGTVTGGWVYPAPITTPAIGAWIENSVASSVETVASRGNAEFIRAGFNDGGLGGWVTYWRGSRALTPCDQFSDWITLDGTGPGAGTTAYIKLP